MRTLFLFLSLLLMGLSAAAKSAGYPSEIKYASPLEGRWDMTVQFGGKPLPSWLEVRHSGHSTLVGQLVSFSGSARPIAKVQSEGSKFSFSLPPQWETGTADLHFEGEVRGDSLAGTMRYPDGKTYSWTGVRAPSLRRSKAPNWGAPVALFNGRDLNGWKAIGQNQWVVEGGILKSPKSGANLMTEASFNDFRLQVEFRYPKGSNSGVYLRGRYEVQISDSKGMEPSVGEFGAVYGFIAPNEMAAREPGEWQTYDITLVGRKLTVVANGKTIICEQEIPGITGGALDSREGEPGPLLIQGDHGPVEFRKILLTPAR